MPFGAGVLISDSRLAFLQGQYEVSLILSKEVLQKEPENSDAHQWRNMNAWHTKKMMNILQKNYQKAMKKLLITKNWWLKYVRLEVKMIEVFRMGTEFLHLSIRIE